MTDRTKAGKFVKGKSGNPSGRPKKVAVSETAKSKYKDDPMQAILHLMNTATNEADVFKYAKELMPYCTPKLSHVKSDIVEEKNITITLEGFENIAMNNAPEELPVDVTPKLEISKEDLAKMKKDKVKALKDTKKKKK